jgi:hypothetical protein
LFMIHSDDNDRDSGDSSSSDQTVMRMMKKQKIILVIQIMTNSLMTLLQVNLRRMNLVMMTQDDSNDGDTPDDNGNSEENDNG